MTLTINESRSMTVTKNLSETVSESMDVTVAKNSKTSIGDNEKVEVGKPHVSGAKVTAEIVAQDLAKKIIVFKMKRRKGYRNRRGHRQPYTELRIESVKG